MSLSKLAECHNVSVLQIANNINIKNSNINNPVMSQKYGSHQCCFRPSFENTHFFSRANSFSKPTGKAHIADDHIESSGFGFQEIPMVDPSHTKHPTLLEDTKPNRDKHPKDWLQKHIYLKHLKTTNQLWVRHLLLILNTLWLIELGSDFQAALAVAKQERPCFTQTCVAISLSLRGLN